MSATEPPRDLTRLKIVDEKGFEKTVLLDLDLLSIGSDSSCGLVLVTHDGETIAPRHALIIRDGGAYVLKDESGPRGTLVNGRPIRRTVLRHGDEITIGSSPLRIHFLVDGTRASDHNRRSIRDLLQMLADIHESASDDKVIRRVADGVLLLLGPRWVKVTIDTAAGQKTAMAGRATEHDGTSSERLPRQVAGSSRSLFQKDHLRVPVSCAVLRSGAVEAGPREGRPYTVNDLEMLEAVAVHLGIALANARQPVGAGEARAVPGRVPD